MKLLGVGLCLVCLVANTSHVNAIGFGGLLDAVKGEKKGQSETVKVDSVAAQDELVQKYIEAANNILLAQSLFAEALGLKKEAAVIKETMDALSSGSVEDQDQIERIQEDLTKNSEILQEETKNREELSTESKKAFAKAFIPYGFGLVDTKQLFKDDGPKFLKGATQTLSASSMTEKLSVKRKLEAGMYLAKEMPSFIEKLYSSASSFLLLRNSMA